MCIRDRKIGTGSDLSIYHDGSNSYIVDQGTGDLRIRADNAVVLQQADGSETYAEFNKSGAVNLYYDNSNKLSTTTSGVSVTGDITASGTVTSNSDISLKTNIKLSQMLLRKSVSCVALSLTTLKVEHTPSVLSHKKLKRFYLNLLLVMIQSQLLMVT